jgi:DNA mismatch repair endonuclease MutH
MDYNPSDEKSILEFAKRLEGKRLGEVISEKRVKGHATVRKGKVGLLYELYFGLKPCNESRPDFYEASVELKTVPLVRGADGKVRIKERTVISMINYMKIVKEEWENASVHKKLRKVLFIFFIVELGKPVSDYMTKKVMLWSPDRYDNAFFELDYEVVRSKVRAGKAHEISEGDCKYLGACRKGAGKGRDMREQPYSKVSAPSRAFALKPCFTKLVLEKSTGAAEFESLVKNLDITDPKMFEEEVLKSYSKYEGKTIGQLAKGFRIPAGSKSFAAMVIRRCLGAKRNESRIEEFDKMGVSIKVVRLDEKENPREAMSFPRFNHMEVIDEAWEDSEFLSQVSRLLIVIMRGKDKHDMSKDTLGNAFFWSPSNKQLKIMEKEWSMFVKLIKAGKADRLPTASETEIVHVRPHAKDSSDTEMAPGRKRVVKKCFWLNKAFIKSIIEDAR